MQCDLNVEKLILLEDFNTQTADNQFVEKTAEDFDDDIEFLISLALQNEKVISVRAFETDNARVFSVLTVPIYLKSEREELSKNLEETLSNGKTTYISFDNDVFRKIKPDMTQEEKTELLNIVLKRQ
ncbi:MAG: hypothetical protein J5815_01080 [Clostridia bacterium]|nr:hypothetical protein [Clostridia bacterium]